MKNKLIKKVLACVLAVMLVLSIGTVSAFAATTLDQDNPSGTATVYYQAGQVTDDGGTADDPTDDTISGTWTVSIPDYIEAAASGETPTEYDVTAKDVLIPYGTSLKVAVAFTDELKLADNTSVTLDYDLQAKQSGASALSSVSTGDTIMTVAAGNPDAQTTTTVGAVLESSPLYSGYYSNIVTFSVTVA